MMIDRIETQLRIHCRAYEVFQLLALGLATAFLTWFLLVWDRAQVSRAHGNDAVWTVGLYALTYWLSHWRLGILLAVGLGLAFGFDLLRRPFQGMFRTPLLPGVERPRHIAHIRRIVVVLKLLFSALLLGHIPFIHLRVGTWLPILLFALVPLPVVLLYLLLYAGEFRLRKMRRPLARHTYPVRSFNVAGVGAPSEEAHLEEQHYSEQSQDFEYMITGDVRGEHLWKGNNALIERIATLLQVNHAAIRLFSNTTDALAHAIKECAASLPRSTTRRVLLTTDAEYGSVAQRISEFATRHGGEARAAQVRALIYRGATMEEVAKHIISKVDDNVSIVCMSNVCFETGFLLPVGKVLDYIATLSRTKRPYVIIDGAQAAGHIRLDSRVLERAHFFATSGHKWLLGRETVGILYRNDSASAMPKLKQEIGTGISLGRWAPAAELRNESRATIPLEPRLSLNAALSDITRSAVDGIVSHGLALRRRFREQVERLQGFKVVPIDAESAICVVECEDPAGLRARLRRRNMIVGLNPPTGGLPASLRICFHYYHSDVDVDTLVEALYEET